MKIDIDQFNNLRLKEVFSGVLMETAEGNQIGVCMRDDTLEINVCPGGRNTDNWWRVNMQTGQIKNMRQTVPTETACSDSVPNDQGEPRPPEQPERKTTMIETIENQAAGGRCAPPPCSPFEEVSDQWDKDSGGERHIRRLSERFWVSVLHRLTGFGYWEWETAIVIVRDESDPKKYARGKWDDRVCLIVRGDHREILADKSEREIMEWYAEHSGERNSMETLLAAISENAKAETSERSE